MSFLPASNKPKCPHNRGPQSNTPPPPQKKSRYAYLIDGRIKDLQEEVGGGGGWGLIKRDEIHLFGDLYEVNLLEQRQKAATCLPRGDLRREANRAVCVCVFLFNFQLMKGNVIKIILQ